MTTGVRPYLPLPPGDGGRERVLASRYSLSHWERARVRAYRVVPPQFIFVFECQSPPTERYQESCFLAQALILSPSPKREKGETK